MARRQGIACPAATRLSPACLLLEQPQSSQEELARHAFATWVDRHGDWIESEAARAAGEMLMAVKTRKTEVRTTKATRRAPATTTKRVTSSSTKRPATATTRARGKSPGDVIGLTGARPPKSSKPPKAAAGKKRRPKGIEVESDRTRSALPQARVRL